MNPLLLFMTEHFDVSLLDYVVGVDLTAPPAQFELPAKVEALQLPLPLDAV